MSGPYPNVAHTAHRENTRLMEFAVIPSVLGRTTCPIHGMPIAHLYTRRNRAMSLVRLLGFRTLTCGCVIGRYRELATSREVTYIEEKGTDCDTHGHRRNHTIGSDRLPSTVTLAARAS